MKRKLALGLVAVVALAAALVASPSKSASSSEKSKTIVLTSENTVVLNQQVDAASVADVLLQAKKLDEGSTLDKIKPGKNSKPIYLFLDTPGGSIQSGLELIDAVKGFERPVHTISLFSASMGFQIAQNLGDRLIVQNGVLMSHRASGGFEGEFGGQSPSQIDSRYRLWMDRLTELDQQTVDRTNGKQTLASYQAAYASELWLTGSKSVAQGYADRVVTVSCDSSLSGTDKRSVEFFGMKISFEISKCPLVTGPLNVQMSIQTNKGMMNTEEFQRANGGFGPYCMQSADANKLCALDTSLNSSKLIEVKTAFKSRYEMKQRTPIPMNIRHSSFTFNYDSATWIAK